MVERSDKTWSTGEGNGKPLQYSCLENPMNSMKRQKDRTLKDELPRSVGAQYATGEKWRNKPRKNEGMELKQNNTQLWMWLVMEVKSDAVTNVRSMNQANWKWSNRRWQEWTSTFLESATYDSLEWVNVTQMTIISTTVGRNPLEEMERPS